MKRRIIVLSIVFCLILTLCCGCFKSSDDEMTREILDQFEEFASIPRPSGHEKAISDYLVKWANEHSLKVSQDEALNVVIDVPATEKMEDNPLIVIQVHMDMVFVCKDGTNLDPLTTEIKTGTNGKYLISDGNTSLGADDGIGLAIALKIAEGKMPHGPLRLIVTTDEEKNMTGVNALKPSILENVSGIINIDSEEEGSVCVSSAAGADNNFEHVFQTVKPSMDSAIKITLKNLSGGHSGSLIHEGRGNAIRILAEALKTLSDNEIDYEMASFNGGTADNAIPSNAEVVIIVKDEDKAVEKINHYLEAAKEKYKQTDPDMIFVVDRSDKPDKAVNAADAKSLVDFILEIPDGVYSWSEYIENFPESSSNLGIFHLNGDGVCNAVSFARSSSIDKMKELNERFSKIAKAHSISSVKVTKSADAWPYDPNSKLLAVTENAYKKCFDKEILVSPVHAGLECGTFALLKPGIEMISIGPTILDPHSIEERCDMTTILPIWQLIEEILKNVQGIV